MNFISAVLICLGLSLSPRTSVLAGTLPKPTIRAQPDSVAIRGMRMIILCLGTSDAWKYLLYQRNFSSRHRMTSTEPGKRAEFLIESIEQHDGGRYYCQYQTTAGWSEFSDHLELVVTGVYDNKPNLSAVPSHVVTSEENIILQCVSWQKYDKFILTKEDRKFSSSRDSQYIYSTRQCQALFPVDSVILHHREAFRCYGYYKENPYAWSEPSAALEIHIPALQPQDHTVENLIRMGVAGLVLMVLGILLFQALHNWRKTQGAAGRRTVHLSR